MVGEDVEERKFVGGSMIGLFVRYPEAIIVGRTVEDLIVSEGVIEVASIEEGRELIFEVGKDVDDRKVVGSFVFGCRVVEKSEGGEVVKDDNVV